MASLILHPWQAERRELLSHCSKYVVSKWRNGNLETRPFRFELFIMSGCFCLLAKSNQYLLNFWNLSQSQSHITTDGQSVIMSRYRAHSGTCDQMLLSIRRLLSEICFLVFLGRPLWREVEWNLSRSRSYFTTVSQSVSQSACNSVK
jgi:hypothetical protein